MESAAIVVYTAGDTTSSVTQVIQSRHNEQAKKLRPALSRGERTPEGWRAVASFPLLEEALASDAPP